VSSDVVCTQVGVGLFINGLCNLNVLKTNLQDILKLLLADLIYFIPQTCDLHINGRNPLTNSLTLQLQFTYRNNVSTIVTVTMTKREHCSSKWWFYFINYGYGFR
jgi:hypothetical protein